MKRTRFPDFESIGFSLIASPFLLVIAIIFLCFIFWVSIWIASYKVLRKILGMRT